jgi:hypothetical protein
LRLGQPEAGILLVRHILSFIVKAAKTYFELRRLLTKVFLKILVPEDASFNQEYGGPWKIVD